jgi:hypothetical protein
MGSAISSVLDSDPPIHLPKGVYIHYLYNPGYDTRYGDRWLIEKYPVYTPQDILTMIDIEATNIKSIDVEVGGSLVMSYSYPEGANSVEDFYILGIPEIPRYKLKYHGIKLTIFADSTPKITEYTVDPSEEELKNVNTPVVRSLPDCPENIQKFRQVTFRDGMAGFSLRPQSQQPHQEAPEQSHPEVRRSYRADYTQDTSGLTQLA